MILPLVMDGCAVLPDNLHWSQERRDVESSGKNDCIKVLLLSRLAADDTSLGAFSNSFCQELHVVTMERCQIARVVDAPLATKWEVGHNEVMILLR